MIRVGPRHRWRQICGWAVLLCALVAMLSTIPVVRDWQLRSCGYLPDESGIPAWCWS